MYVPYYLIAAYGGIVLRSTYMRIGIQLVDGESVRATLLGERQLRTHAVLLPKETRVPEALYFVNAVLFFATDVIIGVHSNLLPNFI